MFVIIDDREMVTSGFTSGFSREGVPSIGFRAPEFKDWVGAAAETDLGAVEAFLLGSCDARQSVPKLIRDRCDAPVIAMNETPSLEQTLGLFAVGVDDVVRQPIHVREIIARVGAIQRRTAASDDFAIVSNMRVFFDGRDPEVDGTPFVLPRRERRILEYMIRYQNKRLTKEQIFDFVYGFCNEEVEVSVVESHISKLRKKLRARIGFDPIDSKRYIGYMLINK
jgi:two-component system, OmpR family, flagellar system response regulator FtcR